MVATTLPGMAGAPVTEDARIRGMRYAAVGDAYSDRSERGSPKWGRTLVSKRVIAQILVSLRVSTMRPFPWLTPSGPRR
jgi:hypothetical protein